MLIAVYIKYAILVCATRVTIYAPFLYDDEDAVYACLMFVPQNTWAWPHAEDASTLDRSSLFQLVPFHRA